MICQIVVEGPNKVGKDLVGYYINFFMNYRIPVYPRGIISNYVYNEKYEREQYDKEFLRKGLENTLLILLTAEEEDLEIRFKINSHEKIDIRDEIGRFEKIGTEIGEKYCKKVLKYNTSYLTPIQIARLIAQYMEKQNDERV